MHTRVTSVDSVEYFKIHILEHSFSCSYHKGMLKLKVLDMLITPSRSLYKDLKDHVALGKCA